MPSKTPFHKEILTKEQVRLLPLVGAFSKDFGLVGGTAVAFQIGHRRSIDFDLFSEKKIGNKALLNKIEKFEKPDKVIVSKLGELTLLIKTVKFTWFRYPYKIDYTETADGIIKMPNLLTLGAMNAYALAQRSKWKDYVDLYFIIKDHHTVSNIAAQAKKFFGGEFNEKLFRTQLGYFNDMNYAEKVEFCPGFEVGDEAVKKALVEFSLQ